MRDFIEAEEAKSYFTIDKAETLLPKIEKIVRRLRHVTKLNREFHKFSYEFYRKLDELESMGCLLKDLELGLVDFYYKFENRDIFLCWKLGEKSIRHWHEIYAGFESRNPIINLARK